MPYFDINDDGWAVVLEIDGSYNLSTSSAAFEFDPVAGDFPAISQIDSTHYLVPYFDINDDGWAVVLEIDGSYNLSTSSAAFEFDPVRGQYPAISQIDSTHYLVPYDGPDAHGFAVVLEIDGSYNLSTSSAAFEFDPVISQYPAISQIDSTHYLVPYFDINDDGWAVVLEIDGSYNLSTSSAAFEFDPVQGQHPAISQIDSTHYLVSYFGPGICGYAVILEVDMDTISIIHQHYATSSGMNYASTSDGAYIATSTAQLLEFTSSKPTATTSNQAQDIYWGVSVPAGVKLGNYAGVNTITAQSDI